MSMKRSFAVVAGCVVALLLSVATEASAATKLYYPNQQRADFSLDVPEDWEIEPADEEGGFVSVTGPTGIQLSFRTIEANKDTIDAAIEQSYEWLFENYDDVKMDDPTDAVENGLEGFSTVGIAKDKSDGHKVVIVMEWLYLKPTHLAEVWFIVDANDKAGLNAGGKVMKSLRARGK
jgi:hypothetical protein